MCVHSTCQHVHSAPSGQLSAALNADPGVTDTDAHPLASVSYAGMLVCILLIQDVGLRWRQHQRKKHKQEQLLQHPEMWYVVLETRDAAVRKQRQAYLAAAMDAAGFAQDSLHDVHHKRRK